MSNSKQPKLGFPVLVYLTTTAPLSLSFRLRIQYNAARKQASFMLGTAASAYLKGASDEHAFVAQYDADNLERNTPNNDQVRFQVPPTRLEELKRDTGTPQIITLTLRLKAACPLWCPRLDALVPAADSSAEAAFKEVIQLSKAKTMHVVLNRKWLTDEHIRLLDIIRSGSEALCSYPVTRYYANFFVKADWTVFGPESPKKRPREASAPSTPPAYKRTIANSSTTPTSIPSPTEVATSPPHPHVVELLGLLSKGNEGEHDVQVQAINCLIARHLPGLLKQTLPDVLEQTLPGLLALPITFPSYTSDLDTPSPSSQSTILYPHNLTSLGAALIPSLIEHLQPQVQNMISASLNRGVDSRRAQAVLEIGEAADEKMTELQLERDRGMEEVGKERDGGIDDLRHEKEEGIEALQRQSDSSMYHVETELNRGRDELRQETIEGVEALQQEKEEAVDDLHRHATEVLEELRADVASIGEYALEDTDARVTERADEIVAATLEQLGMIKDRAMREIKGEKTYLRGRRGARRAGKGGYFGLGHR